MNPTEELIARARRRANEMDNEGWEGQDKVAILEVTDALETAQRTIAEQEAEIARKQPFYDPRLQKMLAELRVRAETAEARVAELEAAHKGLHSDYDELAEASHQDQTRRVAAEAENERLRASVSELRDAAQRILNNYDFERNEARIGRENVAWTALREVLATQGSAEK